MMRTKPDSGASGDGSALENGLTFDPAGAPSEDVAALTALLQRCAAHDAAAFERLYTLVAPLLLGCLVRLLRRRALAEEALQDVFVTIWQRAAQYDQYRGRPRAWLVSIARYRAIDILRAERITPVDPHVLATSLATEADEAGDSDPLGSRDAQRLHWCMEQLTLEQQQSLRLAFVDGRSHSDIAGALGKPLGSIKSWIRRGLLALKECLQT